MEVVSGGCGVNAVRRSSKNGLLRRGHRLDRRAVNVLFLCSKNQWRSPTAERIFRDFDGLAVRSAGTNQSARRVVSLRDIAWADVIFVMEQKHLDRLREGYRDAVRAKVVFVLEIGDDYPYMDKELVEVLKERVCPILESMRTDEE